MHSKNFLSVTIFLCFACNDQTARVSIQHTNQPVVENDIDLNPYQSIGEIPAPAGFTKIKTGANSFGNWLLGIKLKTSKTVYQFDGTVKHNQAAQFAVLDISVGNKDLQQCADAVMRLRAEYLFAEKRYSEIHFTDNAGTIYRFNQPYKGLHLLSWLQQVFAMCGSASLAKQLNAVAFDTIGPGDVLIRGGFPGHAVIVMATAQDRNGQKLYLLAQSYMPAQDIHILINPTNKLLSPWYAVAGAELIETPEFDFKKNELKRWPR